MNTGTDNKTGLGLSSNELRQALLRCRHALITLGIVSAIINILYLTGSFYMLEIYDRVIPSRSVPTLIGLSVLAVVLYAFQALLDLFRSRITVRVGRLLGEDLGDRVFHSLAKLALMTRAHADGLQPMRDLDQVRGFLSSPGPIALLDLPWVPLYLGICFVFHFWLGITALAGVVLLIGLTVLTDTLSKAPTLAATSHAIQRNAVAESSRRNAEVIHAMGMGSDFARRWQRVNAQYLNAQQRAADVGGGFGAIAKAIRLLLQSTMLGVGALLVIRLEATGGLIIAGSILGGRAMAPIDQAIGQWKNFVSFRQSWGRLTTLLASLPVAAKPLQLPSPSNLLEVQSLTVSVPGERRLVVQDVSFRLDAGSALGIIGPSGGGKSSLARALVGVWRSVSGAVKIDGASLDRWAPDALGKHIGYLPQNVELFAGTVAENISRFEAEPDESKILAAAELASVHELILNLPNGYETHIGEDGSVLSAGQRQRIALARALYNEPFFVVLDEPNSNLDPEGEEALTRAILSVRERKGIAIVVAHRPSALAGVDLVMIINQGRNQAFGPKDEVVSKFIRRPTSAPRAL